MFTLLFKSKVVSVKIIDNTFR